MISLLNIYSLVIRTCQTIVTKSYSGRSVGFLPIRNYKWLTACEGFKLQIFGISMKYNGKFLAFNTTKQGQHQFFLCNFLIVCSTKRKIFNFFICLDDFRFLLCFSGSHQLSDLSLGLKTAMNVTKYALSKHGRTLGLTNFIVDWLSYRKS